MAVAVVHRGARVPVPPVVVVGTTVVPVAHSLPLSPVLAVHLPRAKEQRRYVS